LAADAFTLGYPLILLTPLATADRFRAGAELIALPGKLPNWLWPDAYLAFFQYLSWHRTIFLGRDPQRVRNLDKTAEPVVDPHIVDLPPRPHRTMSLVAAIDVGGTAAKLPSWMEQGREVQLHRSTGAPPG